MRLNCTITRTMSGGRMLCDMENQSYSEVSITPIIILLVIIIFVSLRRVCYNTLLYVYDKYQSLRIRRQYHQVMELQPFGSLVVDSEGIPH